MSYSEVQRILGSPGDEVSSNEIEGVPGVMDDIRTVMYMWQNSDGSNMNVVGRHRKKHEAQREQILRMEFRTFLDQFISILRQILRHGRRVIYRLLGYRDLTPAFFRLSGRLNI